MAGGIPVVITTRGAPVTIDGTIPASAIPMGSPGDPAGPLGPDGKIPSSQLPPLEHDIARAATQAEMLALAVTTPAICIRTDFTPPHMFYLVADPATNLANWEDTGEFGASTANPSVLVGLTAKNGTADTIMRSDAAPALDQAIVPTWTEVHTFAKDVIGQAHVAATNAAASTPGALGSSVQMFTSGNVSTVAHVNSLNVANSRTAFTQWDNNYTYTIGFANDAFNSFIKALEIQCSFATGGVNSIKSNSGSGIWDHSGPFQANGITSFTFNGNGIVLNGAASGGVPSISSMGANANVSLEITTKGSGGISLSRNTNVVGTFSTSGAVTFGGNMAVSGTGTFAGNVAVAGQLGSAANTSLPSPTNSGIIIGGAPTWAMQQFYDQSNTANNRSADLLFISNSIKFRFANDARNAFTDVLSINGGQALGVTGVTSTSGTGAWAHTGQFSVTIGGTPRFIVTAAGDLQAAANYIPATPDSLVTVSSVPLRVSADGKTAQAANVNVPALYSVPTSGLYRVSSYIVISQAATTSSTMPSVTVEYTDATIGAALSELMTNTSNANTVGTHLGGSAVISAQQGTNIGYVTAGYASSGATAMQYAVHMKIEFLG